MRTDPPSAPDGPADGLLRMDSPAGRWAIAATVSGSAVAMIAGTVVNVALPDIAEGVGAGTVGVQWILNSYLLTLASLILVGGVLGDIHGRRRIYVMGTVVFGLASIGAAAAPTLGWLLVARAVMGIGGALLTPGSLAILEASFVAEDRSAAIGAWAGLGGVAAAVGPMVGGLLLDVAGWRALFLLNVPVCALAVVMTLRHLPESRDETTTGTRLDWMGAAIAVAGLGLLTYGLIGLGEGITTTSVSAAVGGLVLLGAFVAVERRQDNPLVPPGMFANRTFSVANGLTFVVYAALGGVFFLLIVFLRQVLGYSGLEAGAATLPLTLMMLALSARAGRLATRIGPRLPLTIGPLVLAAGMVVYSRLGEGSTYLTGVLPGVLLFGAGLVLLVAPVTATVLAAAEEGKAGVASGVNNAVARTAGLIAVAVLPPAAGLGPAAFDDATLYAAGFSRAMLLTAGLAVIGAAIAWFGLEATLRTEERPVDDQEVLDHPHAALDCPPAVRPDHHRVGGTG